MRSIADALRDEGKEQWLQQGLQQGLQQVYESKKEIAAALLAEGFSLEKVAQINQVT